MSSSDVIARSPRRPWIAGLAVCAAGIAGVLIAPFGFPTAQKIDIVSAAAMAGFNTRVADLAAAALSAAVLVLAWRGRLGAPGEPPPASRLTPRFSLTTIALTLAMLGFACWIVNGADIRYHSDAGYFREQLMSYVLNGRRLYTELEFPYGPLVMWLPAGIYAAIRHWGGSLSAAYFISLVAAQGVGMLALAFTMNRLPMRALYRRIIFVVFCLGACVPLLGLNYTLLRFALPLAVLLLATGLQRPWTAVVALTAGQVLLLAISPEIGLAYLAACWAYAACYVRSTPWSALGAALLPVLAAAILLATLHSYLRILIAFGRGVYNLPLEPAPHILIYLFALLWLVPRFLGNCFAEAGAESSQEDPHLKPALAALYVFAIFMVPSTFGRSDPLHVFFNGLAILLLSVAAASRLSKRAGAIWLVCVLFLVAWMQAVNLSLDRIQITEALDRGLMPHLSGDARRATVRAIALIAPTQAAELAQPVPPATLLDIPRLESFIGKATVATPEDIDWTVERQLRATGHFRPDYFSYMAGVLSSQSEERKVHAMDQAQWALVEEPMTGPWTEAPDNIGNLLGIRFHYPIRHPALYYHGALLQEDLRTNWRPVADFANYRLYRHALPGAGEGAAGRR